MHTPAPHPGPKKRPPRPADTPWMIPYLTVRDCEKAMDFCERAFGFTRGVTVPGPDGKLMHAEMNWRDTRVMFSPESMRGSPAKSPATSGQTSPMAIYFYVDDVDSAFKQAVAAGAQPAMPPQDMFWGDRMSTVKDPVGYMWSMATNVGEFDMSKMPKR